VLNVSNSLLNDQPITLRSNKSSTAVKYIQPFIVRRYVISDTHFYPGFSAKKLRFSIFSHTGSECANLRFDESVVRMYFLLRRAFKPFSRINIAAFLRLTLIPYFIQSSFLTLTIPYRR